MSASVTMYTTSWCPFCHMLKARLADRGIVWDEIDIDADEEAAVVVMQANNGNRTVPTLVYSDGSTQTNPSAQQVELKLAELSEAV